MNGSLYKRGSVYWMAVRVEGKLYRESTGKTTKREAIDFLDERKKEIKENKLPNAKLPNYKFAELSKEYGTFVENQKGYRSKKTFIRQLVEVFGNMDLRDLDTKKVEKWQSKLLKTRKPATVNRKLACLKHMLTKAIDWNMASEETLKQVRKVKFMKEKNRKLRFLNTDECQRLIDCCSPHLKPIVITAIHTGMRRGEILGLKWEQIDLRHGFISLTDTKSGEGRQISINDTLRMMFEEMPHSIESVYVFAGRDGDPLTDVKHSFNTALRKAEICNATFHTLRHTFASQLVMAGVDLTTVKELLGHKSLNMTLRYSHLAPEHKSKAVKVLDEIMVKRSTSEKICSQFVHNLTPEEPATCHKS